MVQRTRLVIVLLLAFLAGILSAQQSSFTPPALVSEAVLELPSDWIEEYSPAETTIIVAIKADSSATLFKILDDKAELQPLIEALLPNLEFTPAFIDENAIDANLTLKLNLVKRTQIRTQVMKPVSDSLKTVDKAVLKSWINRQLERENLQQMFSSDTGADNIFAPQTSDTFYRTNFYTMGLNSRPFIIMKDGFIQPARLNYNAHAYQMLSNFRHISVDGNLMSFANEKYPLPAMCTDVYAGLGDYEFNFARVQVFKNHLMGWENFYMELGFLGQNGWWQETISDQTSARIFLDIPLHFYGTKLIFNYETYDQNIPSTTLLPGMQNGTLFTIGQKLYNLYLKLDLPWFTVGWQSSKEKLSAPGILNDQEFNAGNILVEHELRFLNTDFKLTYQYNDKPDTTQIQTLYQYNKQTKHLGLIKINHSNNYFQSENQILVSENGLENADLHLSKAFNPILMAGLNYKYNNGEHQTIVNPAFYIDDSADSFPSTFIKQVINAEIEWRTFNNINTKISAGTKKIDTDYGVPVPSGHSFSSNNNPFAELNLSANRELGKITASLEQTLQWNDYNEQFYELPELSGQTRFKLVRDMGHDNALSAGLNLTGHSDYSQADNQSTPIYGSLIADAWLGVKITDLFEFQLMMKNLGDNTIFGLYPHPRTIIGTIHWFYLN